ncbi:MAG TPA: alpha/beta fold hydrolase [Williamwhitmania sp.]|nr:alpha/beta fold hydrolase [Williamwhitmania sp.]
MKAQKAILTALLTLGLFATLNAQPATSGIREEAVSFTRGDATYSGTLSLPANEGIYPLVIMVSGMGNQDREWSFMRGKYKMAKIISDYLNQNGIAVYRYDDRGFGKSTGTAETQTSFDDLAEDVYAAVSTLKEHKEIGKVGLLGHSLGGILSIMAASRHNDIDFIITLSGSYQNGGDIMMEQARTLKRWKTAADMTEEQTIANGEKFVRSWISYSTGGAGLDTMKQILSDLIKFQIEKMPPEIMAKNLQTYKDTADLYQQSLNEVMAYYTSPHQKSFAVYDPAEDFKKVTCPVLILFGEKDKHVVVSSNLPKVAQVLPESLVTDLTIKIIPNADHGYSDAEHIKNGEMVPGTTEFIANWVNSRK